MLLFGHVGITAGAARLTDVAFLPEVLQQNRSGFRYRIASVLRYFRDASGNLDYRMIIVGSMLPDIIDKPLFLLFSESGLFTGRSHAHTLIFAALLLSAGILSRKSWLLTLALANFTHLILDSLWENPEILLWPFLGGFEPYEAEGWFSDIWYNLTHLPEIYIPEIIGLIVTGFLAYKIVKIMGINRFIRQGVIG
ncbi:MAG: metal-dependent hydrolase [Dehalococcoidales bacterium]|nr:metal-dependent hydrolase [Dehalococcoidales bacterium]